MPFTKEALTTAYNLSVEDVEQTLLACELPVDQAEYSDADITNRFEKIRLYLNEGKAASYEVAKDLLNQESQASGKRKKSGRGKPKTSQDFDGAGPSASLAREQILGRIQSLMELAGGISAEEFRDLLPELGQQRMAELIKMYDRGLLSSLSEMATSGELEQVIRQTAAGKKSLPEIPSLFLEAEVIEEQPPSSPPLLNESSNNKSSS